MLITFLIMKLTFGAILNECNRMALEADKAERSRWIKTRLIRLRTDYEKGIIDEKAYAAGEEAILKDLRNGVNLT
ncbi:MAG TPA: hypothetical protein VFV16_02715 [Candidatus Nitrosotalea sp.]|nr:hypothetical protein [Candidatus Nitrosotalea sp.]